MYIIYHIWWHSEPEANDSKFAKNSLKIVVRSVGRVVMQRIANP